MALRFTLCSECRAEYSALRLDPDATCWLNIMPLSSLMWSDEHPDGIFKVDRKGVHGQCYASAIRLAAARTALWRTGAIPEASGGLWEEARQLLPEWPGFSRLTLNQEQRASLEGCDHEVNEVMQTIMRRFPDVTTTDEGGGLIRFRATRKPPAPRPWWQFWK